MALTPPPPAPQRGDRTTFSGRVDAFLTWLTALIPQINAFTASLTTLSAGGANAFVYTVDTATADADPGNSVIRFGSSGQNTSIVLRVDNIPGQGGDIGSLLDSLQAGTSNVKGSIRIQRVTDTTKWLLFDVTSVTSLSGYRNLSVIPRAGSETSPFVKNDQVIVFIDRSGDKGDGGGTPTQQQIRDAVGTLPISNGGTGATTAAQAITNLGGKPAGIEPVATGGTGAATVEQARAVLQVMPLTGGTFIESYNVKLGGALGTQRVALNVTQGDNKVRYRFGIDSDESPVIFVNDLNGNYVGMVNFPAGGVTASGPVSGTKCIGRSDERLKSDWRALPASTLERFAAIERVGLFKWTDGNDEAVGIGAQSLAVVIPSAVTEVKGVLHVDHGGANSALIHLLARRLLALEAACRKAGIEL